MLGELEVSLKVEDVMVEDVVTVEDDVTVKRAVAIMNKYEIGCLVVTKRGKPVGIVTERDMLTRVLAESRNPETTKIADIVSRPLVIAEPDMDLEEAARLMFKMKVKKLPVVSDSRLVGLVTLTDIARFQPQIIKILKKIQASETAPKRMKKVADYYVV
jgi:CBS domain-containing protein